MGSAKRIEDFEQITMKVIVKQKNTRAGPCKKAAAIPNIAVPLSEMTAAAYPASLFQLWATYPFSIVITH